MGRPRKENTESVSEVKEENKKSVSNVSIDFSRNSITIVFLDENKKASFVTYKNSPNETKHEKHLGELLESSDFKSSLDSILNTVKSEGEFSEFVNENISLKEKYDSLEKQLKLESKLLKESEQKIHELNETVEYLQASNDEFTRKENELANQLVNNNYESDSIEEIQLDENDEHFSEETSEEIESEESDETELEETELDSDESQKNEDSEESEGLEEIEE